MAEGRGRADSVFLPCLFCLPAAMGERKKRKGGKREVWSRLRPQQMLIRRGGLVSGQLSTKPTLR